MVEFFTAETMAALATLTILEIVLGIDNIVFISIISSRLPVEKRGAARKLGLVGALVIRLLFLFMVTWIIGLDTDLFQIFGHDFSWKDIILIGGGLFLIAKGTREIHVNIEGQEKPQVSGKKASANMFFMIVAQIMVLDVVFSIDSILTAIGMTQIIEIMVIAIVISIAVMMWAVTPVSAFIEKHPTVKMLALSFLLLIGIALIADGTGTHIPRAYLYFAIVFSIFVEVLNLAAAKRKKPKKKQ